MPVGVGDGSLYSPILRIREGLGPETPAYNPRETLCHSVFQKRKVRFVVENVRIWISISKRFYVEIKKNTNE